MTVRTRFAPSPTGTPESIHLGFIIRGLWNYALAKKNNGQFILRIEDTDKKRSRKDTEEAIFKSLKDFGVFYDEGPDIGGPYSPYRQSDNLKEYQEAAHKLVDQGLAYYDFDAKAREKEEIKEAYESEEGLAEVKTRPQARNADPKESKKRMENGEPYVVRVKMPEDRIFEYEDWVLKKKVRISGKEIPDLILLKSDGYPTYHLAAIVDDLRMKISHVLRGQEWISTTPIHLFLFEALGNFVPQIGHFTVILDPRTGKKFSKRDMTAMFGVQTWLDNGYLKDAVLNYLMLLGWAPKDNREIFSLEEFIQAFDQAGVQKANPTFNPKKLDWFNEQYIRKLNNEDLANKLGNFTSRSGDEIKNVLPLIKDRLVTLKDFDSLTEYFFSSPKVDPNLFAKYPDTKRVLDNAIGTLGEDFDGKILEENARAFCQTNDVKVGDYFMILRLAITGRGQTPPLWEVMQILGKDETLKRLKSCLLEEQKSQE